MKEEKKNRPEPVDLILLAVNLVFFVYYWFINTHSGFWIGLCLWCLVDAGYLALLIAQKQVRAKRPAFIGAVVCEEMALLTLALYLVSIRV